MSRLLLICLGGAIGTGARYLLSGWLTRASGPGFPWGTLVVNVLGSFLLAAIMEASILTGRFSPDLRLFLTTGVLGGFTTYSTFNYETLHAFQEGAGWIGAANLIATVVACLVAGILGVWTGRFLGGT